MAASKSPLDAMLLLAWFASVSFFAFTVMFTVVIHWYYFVKGFRIEDFRRTYTIREVLMEFRTNYPRWAALSWVGVLIGSILLSIVTVANEWFR